MALSVFLLEASRYFFMPAQKSGKLMKPAAKPVAKKVIKPAPAKAATKLKVVKTAPPSAKTAATTKAKAVPATKSPAKPSEKAAAKDEVKKPVKAAATEEVVKKKPGRPPKAQSAAGDAPAKTGAKRGRKPKSATEGKTGEDMDMSDIEDDLAGEPVVETTEKVKPLRMKISKAKERALMKEFGLDEAILTEEEMLLSLIHI